MFFTCNPSWPFSCLIPAVLYGNAIIMVLGPHLPRSEPSINIFDPRPPQMFGTLAITGTPQVFELVSTPVITSIVNFRQDVCDIGEINRFVPQPECPIRLRTNFTLPPLRPFVSTSPPISTLGSVLGDVPNPRVVSFLILTISLILGISGTLILFLIVLDNIGAGRDYNGDGQPLDSAHLSPLAASVGNPGGTDGGGPGREGGWVSWLVGLWIWRVKQIHVILIILAFASGYLAGHWHLLMDLAFAHGYFTEASFTLLNRVVQVLNYLEMMLSLFHSRVWVLFAGMALLLAFQKLVSGFPGRIIGLRTEQPIVLEEDCELTIVGTPSPVKKCKSFWGFSSPFGTPGGGSRRFWSPQDIRAPDSPVIVYMAGQDRVPPIPALFSTAISDSNAADKDQSTCSGIAFAPWKSQIPIATWRMNKRPKLATPKCVGAKVAKGTPKRVQIAHKIVNTSRLGPVRAAERRARKARAPEFLPNASLESRLDSEIEEHESFIAKLDAGLRIIDSICPHPAAGPVAGPSSAVRRAKKVAPKIRLIVATPTRRRSPHEFDTEEPEGPLTPGPSSRGHSPRAPKRPRRPSVDMITEAIEEDMAWRAERDAAGTVPCPLSTVAHEAQVGHLLRRRRRRRE